MDTCTATTPGTQRTLRTLYMSVNLLIEFEKEDTAVHRKLKVIFDLVTTIYLQDKGTSENKNETELSLGREVFL